MKLQLAMTTADLQELLNNRRVQLAKVTDLLESLFPCPDNHDFHAALTDRQDLLNAEIRQLDGYLTGEEEAE